MTYTGAMVLPNSAVVIQDEEMRYVEGGASWSKEFTTQNKKHKYLYRINISNITAAKKSILSTAACVAIMAGALLSGIGSSGLALAGNVCAALGAFAQLGMSAAELKKCVTVTQIKKYY